MVLDRASSRVAFSNAYHDGRVEDLAFERRGPTARERHHIRLWSIDSARTIRVGAADEDIGLKVEVSHLDATHRVAADIDDERVNLSRDLESDGRTAVLKVGCGSLDDVTR